jgi:hypothetical protein
MRIGQRQSCLFCLCANCFEAKLDRKSRPYFSCCSCGARVFIRNDMSLKGPTALWGALESALSVHDVEAARVLIGEKANANAQYAHA